MRISLTSVFVEDQAEALAFYTDVLGFQVAVDIPVGDARWLTVVSPDDPDGAQLLLEPNGTEIATTFQRALHEQGIPAAAFATDDVEAEVERLRARGVKITMEPTPIAETVMAVFDDTCGNLIEIYRP